MAQFCLQIAGYTASVNSIFESTPDYLRPYVTDAAPDFSVTVTQQDLDFEQTFSLREALEEGFRPRVFTQPFLERAAIQRAFAEFLFDRQILLFHGSAVAVDGEGYLFTANSGVGKSTHTRLWREVLGNRAVMVNDDKPFLSVGTEGVFVWGSPWSGKHGLDTNCCVPLKGLCVLVRGKEDCIRRAAPEQLLPMLYKQSYHPLDADKLPSVQALARRLAAAVPLWQMECTKDRCAAQIAYSAMAKTE